jgi:putative membrane protein
VKKFINSWLVNTVAVMVAVSVVNGLHYVRLLDLFVASFVLGTLNTFLRPLLMLLTLPLMILSLGLFTLIINGLLLYLVGWLLQPQFSVAGFWPAVKGALVISIISLVLNMLLGTRTRVRFQRSQRPPPPPDDNRGDPGGPVIDV